MNVDDGRKSRAALKTYFVKNAIPTEGQFAQLIDSGLNQRDDGLVKAAGDPLCIEAAGDDTSFKKALNFYTRLADADPAWTVSLRPRANPNDPLTGRAGLSINDAAGNSRLCIDGATGQVGVGVVAPGEMLEVGARVKAGGLTIGPWPADPGNYMFVGASSLDQSSTGNYALLQGLTGGDRGRTYLNSPVDIHFRIGNSDRMVLMGDGQLSIGATDPSGFRLYLPGRAGPWQNALAILADRNIRGKDLLTLIRFGNAGDYQMIHKASGYFNRNMLGLHCEARDSLGFYSTDWTPLLEVAGGSGDTYVRGQLEIGDSAVFFMGDGGHQHVGRANNLNHAAIENATNHGALMILGRAVSINPLRRVVRMYDDVYIAGRLNDHGADLAEIYFSDARLEPGDVVGLDPDQDQIIATEASRDQGVIGVISANPGFVLNSQSEIEAGTLDGPAGYPVALCGRVPCKVTDEGGPIRRGDLLTSASRPGHAMRAQPIGPEGVFRSGTIIGKALGSLAAGDGMIDIFVMLH